MITVEKLLNAGFQKINEVYYFQDKRLCSIDVEQVTASGNYWNAFLYTYGRANKTEWPSFLRSREDLTLLCKAFKLEIDLNVLTPAFLEAADIEADTPITI